MRNQGLFSANSKQILIWKHLSLFSLLLWKKNTPLAFDTVEILNNNILCIIWGARNKLDKSLWSIFPRSLTTSGWEEIYSSFSQSDSKLGSTGGNFNFFWIFLTGESVPSLHPAGEMAGRSASCGQETAEIGPACPGDESWRMMKNLFWR